MIELDLPDLDATSALAHRLGDTLPPQCVAYLHGDLGAGKTTLARALLQHLGVRGAIRSPTYTLIERYSAPGCEVAHLDLYRIADPEELLYLGLDDLAEQVRLWLVEWPERGAGALPRADLAVYLSMRPTGRHARLAPLSPVGEAWLRALDHTPAERRSG